MGGGMGGGVAMIGADCGAAVGGGVGAGGGAGLTGAAAAAAGGAPDADAGMLDAAASVSAGGGAVWSGWGADIGAPLVRPWVKPFEKSPAGAAGWAAARGDVDGVAGIEVAGGGPPVDRAPLKGLGADDAVPGVGKFGAPGAPVGDRGKSGGSTVSPCL
ncbi:MAG: hypothetical protein QOH60_89 [Mycobacterium sp.]|jgi:hypothetical protein|nr:hypothetical protein [Mycobacterium sp.]